MTSTLMLVAIAMTVLGLLIVVVALVAIIVGATRGRGAPETTAAGVPPHGAPADARAAGRAARAPGQSSEPGGPTTAP